MNKIRLMCLLGTALLFAAAAAPSRAAVLPGEWYVMGGAGWVNGNEVLSSVNSTFGDSGATRTEFDARTGGNSALFSAQINYQLSPNVGLGLYFLMPRYSRTEHVTAFHEEIILMSARYLIMPERNWNPYLIGGAGAATQYFHTRGVYCGNCSSQLSPLPVPEASFNSLGFAGLAGLGVQGELKEHLVGGLETGIIYTPGGSEEIPGEAVVPTFTPTRISNGISFSRNVAFYAAATLGFDFGGRGRP